MLSPKENVCGDRVWETDKPLDTMFHHRLKPDDFRSLWQHLTESAQHLAYFYLESYFVREFDRFQVQLQPKAILILNQLWAMSHQLYILRSYFSLVMTSFYDEISESTSILQHDFFWLYADMIMSWQRSLMTIQESTNTDHSQCNPKVFYLFYRT